MKAHPAPWRKFARFFADTADVAPAHPASIGRPAPENAPEADAVRLSA
jgi:hypothetical protein